jgi:hypothetical protein
MDTGGVELLELFVVVSWLLLVFYAAWLFGWAKQYATLTPGEVYALWSLHKRETRCSSLSYIWKFHRKKGVVGFKCFCGHEYKSKRPIV